MALRCVSCGGGANRWAVVLRTCAMDENGHRRVGAGEGGKLRWKYGKSVGEEGQKSQGEEGTWLHSVRMHWKFGLFVAAELEVELEFERNQC